jgi:hypothetical protein
MATKKKATSKKGKTASKKTGGMRNLKNKKGVKSERAQSIKGGQFSVNFTNPT